MSTRERKRPMHPTGCIGPFPLCANDIGGHMRILPVKPPPVLTR